MQVLRMVARPLREDAADGAWHLQLRDDPLHRVVVPHLGVVARLVHGLVGRGVEDRREHRHPTEHVVGQDPQEVGVVPRGANRVEGEHGGAGPLPEAEDRDDPHVPVGTVVRHQQHSVRRPKVHDVVLPEDPHAVARQHVDHAAHGAAVPQGAHPPQVPLRKVGNVQRGPLDPVEHTQGLRRRGRGAMERLRPVLVRIAILDLARVRI
mmetsp:Transcript_53623/g.122399  ORF Transcript_53623/g.122399 Transcript_53623/m.122399 type:complete len:208 (-) Transcript_53623:966-1589(-)